MGSPLLIPGAPDWVAALPPGAILMLGGLLLTLVPRRVQAHGAVALGLLGLLQVLALPAGIYGEMTAYGHELVLVRADRLSLLFGTIFHIAATVSALYALHVRHTTQHVAATVYAGAAIAAAFAGDLITLFIWWELTAISSVFLIWARGAELEDPSLAEGQATPRDASGDRAIRTGLRYLIIQVASGVILLSGVLMLAQQGASLDFGGLGEFGVFAFESWAEAPWAVRLILLAFGIKAAFPFLHNWLQDAYPQATVTGTVFLSAFTTKLAIYALARGFAGTDMLIGIGVTMTLFPIFFAVVENDLRKVLAYSLNNQLGFMVVGVGVGTALSLNGTVAHAFSHILYKGLLFMSVGAVLYRTGTAKASELGGLYKSMPWTTLFCIIGAMSISAFPLFSGFVSKGMVLMAVAEEHMTLVWLGLLMASAGVMEHSGIKIPFFAFFAHDQGHRVKEAPTHMLIAMGITAAFCIGVGVLPGPLYDMLPFPVEDFKPYTGDHVLTQLQLLFFAALAFGVLMRSGAYPAEIDAVNLDTDWVYRRLLPRWAREIRAFVDASLEWIEARIRVRLFGALSFIDRVAGPQGRQAQTWPTGKLAIWAAILLGAYLALYYA